MWEVKYKQSKAHFRVGIWLLVFDFLVHVFHMFGVRDSDRMVRDRQAAKGKKTELVDLLLAHGARDLHSAGLFLLALPV